MTGRRFTQGFAVFVGEDCDVATVSPTLRGAIVNALVRRFGVIVLDKHTDAEIAKLWERAKAQRPEVRVAVVEIGEVGEVVADA